MTQIAPAVFRGVGRDLSWPASEGDLTFVARDTPRLFREVVGTGQSAMVSKRRREAAIASFKCRGGYPGRSSQGKCERSVVE